MPDDQTNVLSPAQAAFLERHFGIVAVADTKPPAALLPTWIQARTSVGEQIASLEKALKAADWPLFDRIAEFGLAAFTGRKLTKLEVAVREFDGAKPDTLTTMADKLRQALSELEGFASGDEVLGMLDDNPFGAPTRLRDTLIDAMKDLRAGVDARLATA